MDIQDSFKHLPQSLWIDTTPKTDYCALDEDIETDVTVVGGGIAGITTAYLLQREGLKVVLLDAGRILCGTTGHTTAKITSQHTLKYDGLIKHFGEEKAKQYAEANEKAISFVHDMIQTHHIDCDFLRQPAYVYTCKDEYVTKIEQETEAAKRLGLKASYHHELELPFKVKAAMRFDDQAMFHPRKYLLSLASLFVANGGLIYENTRAFGIKEEDQCLVECENGRSVLSKYAVVASHFPFYDRTGLYFSRIFPSREYVLALQTEDKFPEGMYVSAEEEGYSLRQHIAGKDADRLILLTGSSHKTGQGGDTRKHYEELRSAAESMFTLVNIPYRWSTQDYTTMDDVPYIGWHTSRTRKVFVATGFGKWGMSNGTVAGMLIRDLIARRDSPWEPVYSPARFEPVASASKFVSENANVAGQLIGGKIEKLVDADRPNPGRKCTHMGCELMRNEAENSWDCPCHGSRFSEKGEVLEGPAIRSLDD